MTGPKFLNTDLSLFKIVPIRERMKFEFRAEFFNVFNHPQLANPEATITSFVPGSGSFGNVDSIVADNRDIQFGAKLIF